MGYVTLKDIADKAGVTVTTVSRALKDKSDIGVETKKKIKQIADKLGYIPDSHASRLRSNSNKTVGVVVTYLDNFFYSRILIGISDALRERGYTPITFSNSEDPKDEEQILKTLASNRVAGVLIVPGSDLENSIDYGKYSFPVVTIVRKKLGSRINFFVNDSEKSGLLVGRHFAMEGRRNPAYLGVDLPISCNVSRRNGYRKGLESMGVELSSRRIIENGISLTAAYRQTRELFDRDRKIDSIFVYNDNIAFAVIRALHDMGIRIPDDVSIIGHDDIKEAMFYNPSLSSVKVPRYKLGFESASGLLKLIEGNSIALANQVYEPELIIRET